MQNLQINEAMSINEIITLVSDFTNDNVFIFQIENVIKIYGMYNNYNDICLYITSYTNKIDLIEKLNSLIPRFYRYFNITTKQTI